MVAPTSLPPLVSTAHVLKESGISRSRLHRLMELGRIKATLSDGYRYWWEPSAVAEVKRLVSERGWLVKDRARYASSRLSACKFCGSHAHSSARHR